MFINGDVVASLDEFGLIRLCHETTSFLKQCIDVDVIFVVGRALPNFLWNRAIADNITCLHFSQLGLLDDLILETRGQIEALTPEAVDIASNLDHVCLRFKDIMAEAGDRAAAIDWANRAIKAKPFAGRGYFELSRLYMQEKDLESAYEQAAIALKREPRNKQFQQHAEALSRQIGHVPAAP